MWRGPARCGEAVRRGSGPARSADPQACWAPRPAGRPGRGCCGQGDRRRSIGASRPAAAAMEDADRRGGPARTAAVVPALDEWVSRRDLSLREGRPWPRPCGPGLARVTIQTVDRRVTRLTYFAQARCACAHTRAEPARDAARKDMRRDNE